MLSISTACIFSGDILSIPDNTPLDTCVRRKEGRGGKKGTMYNRENRFVAQDFA